MGFPHNEIPFCGGEFHQIDYSEKFPFLGYCVWKKKWHRSNFDAILES